MGSDGQNASSRTPSVYKPARTLTLSLTPPPPAPPSLPQIHLRAPARSRADVPPSQWRPAAFRRRLPLHLTGAPPSPPTPATSPSPLDGAPPLAASPPLGNPVATAAPSLSSFRSGRQVLQALGGLLLGPAHAPARSSRRSTSPRRFVSCAPTHPPLPAAERNRGVRCFV
jgi:hypothetical protein